jgi:hypothetical protein
LDNPEHIDPTQSGGTFLYKKCLAWLISTLDPGDSLSRVSKLNP